MSEFESLPPVSIVIPTWNAARFVERVLQSLWALDYPHFELLVIDNGVSNEDTRQVVQRWELLFHQRSCKLKIAEYRELLGYAGAVNEGVRLAEYDLVAITNNDNLPNRLWLRELVSVWNLAKWNGKDIAAVSANVSRPGIDGNRMGTTNIWGRVVFFDQKLSEEPRPTLHPDGSSFLMSRRLLGIPYLNDYFIYHEDVYLGLRIWQEGFACLQVPRARVESFDGGSTKRIAYKTAYYSERNRILNWLLFFSTTNLLFLFPILKLDALLAFVFGRHKRARIAAWFWIINNCKWWLEKRSERQKFRKVSDVETFAYSSSSYFGSASGLKGFVNFIFSAYVNIFLRFKGE